MSHRKLPYIIFAVDEDGNVAYKGFRGIAMCFDQDLKADQSTRGWPGRHSAQLRRTRQFYRV